MSEDVLRFQMCLNNHTAKIQAKVKEKGFVVLKFQKPLKTVLKFLYKNL